MAAKDRLLVIRDRISKVEKVSVTELSELCHVTEETIRKDLTKLEKEGFVTRVHGGAILNQPTILSGVHYNQRKMDQEDEKRIIARNVCDYLKNTNTIFADASSTVIEALKLVPDEWNLTVVTNSTAAFMELAEKNMNIISTGGKYNRRSLSLRGILAKEFTCRYNVEVALIGCKALNMINGVQDSNENEADIKRTMVEHAQKVILLLDHTKFDQTSFVSLLDINKVDIVVTDQYPGDNWARYFEDKGIKLIAG